MTECNLRLNNGSSIGIDLEIGDYVIDCGANIGDITDTFQRAGATVLAFEPNKHAFRVLRNRFYKNPRVKCFPMAVAGTNHKKKKLFLHERASEDQLLHSTGSSLIEDKNNIDKDEYTLVETIRLSSFIKMIKQKIKVLKVDIEGAEVELINDLIDSGVARDIPYIFVETHENKIPSLVESTATLKERIKEENYSNINLNWI